MTMIGKFEEPRCNKCGSKHCIGKYDYLYPDKESTCPFDGPEDRASVMSEFTFFDLAFNIVAVNCCECGARGYVETNILSWPESDFETFVNDSLNDQGWSMVDGFPVCPNCKD